MSASDDGGPPTVPIGEPLDGRAPPPELPCTDKTTLFFSGTREDIDQAKQLCAGCLVRAQCLELVLRLPEHQIHGVWAGRDEKTLRLMRRGLKVVE